MLTAGNQASRAFYDFMAAAQALGSTINGVLVTVQAPNGPYASNSTPIYQCQLVDIFGVGIPAASFSSLWLSIFDTLSGQTINNCNRVSILNVGRGTVDSSGNLTVTLTSADTDTGSVPSASQVQRSLLIGWTYSNVTSSGSSQHQVDFLIRAFQAPSGRPLTPTVLIAGAM